MKKNLTFPQFISDYALCARCNAPQLITLSFRPTDWAKYSNIVYECINTNSLIFEKKGLSCYNYLQYNDASKFYTLFNQFIHIKNNKIEKPILEEYNKLNIRSACSKDTFHHSVEITDTLFANDEFSIDIKYEKLNMFGYSFYYEYDIDKYYVNYYEAGQYKKVYFAYINIQSFILPSKEEIKERIENISILS
jgi:hypothetical protein